MSDFVNSRVRSVALAAVIAVCGAIATMMLTEQASADSGLLLDCSQVSGEGTNLLECDFRAKNPVQPEELALSINGEVIEKPSFTPFLTGQKKSAWLYLIDRSNPRRKATVQRNIDIVRSQLRNASLRRLIGVATFASDLELVLEPAAAHDNPDARLDAITADGMATEYFANALAAIDVLKGVDADRKALVIMSDGKAEDTAYERTDVVKAAREAGVTIIGIGFAEKETDTPFLQKVRRLAEETDGLFASVVGNEPVPSRFLSDLARSVENGGSISTALAPDLAGPANVKLDIRSSDGGFYGGTQTVELVSVAPVIEEPVVPLSPIGQIYSIVSEEMGIWADTNQALAWLGLLLIPLLLVGFLVFANRKPAQQDPEIIDEPVTGVRGETSETTIFDDPDEEEAKTHIVTDPGANQTFGYFEVVGNEDTRYDITLQSMSIGRHSDNDMQLTNDTVHRHHAHFFISPDGVATIKDLDTVNGVIVSGERVSSAPLKSGDVIELGEVRLRYQSNQ